MFKISTPRRELTRRGVLRSGALSAVALAQPARALDDVAPKVANGSSDPFPVPWLDKNGSHNQAAGLNLEPSHVYHFKGFVARCNTFSGMGTDNKGNRLPFGSATTDYGVMSGEYWAARTTQHGTFAHL